MTNPSGLAPQPALTLAVQLIWKTNLGLAYDRTLLVTQICVNTVAPLQPQNQASVSQSSCEDKSACLQFSGYFPEGRIIS